MRFHTKMTYVILVCAAMLMQPAGAVVLTCDISGDLVVNAIDVQLCINKALGLDITGNADVNGDDDVNAVDVQVVINAALGIVPDSDGDGLDDVFEVNYDGDPGYNPYPAGGDLDADSPDTDGDGVSDGIEIDAGTHPLDPDDAPADSDGDGLYDPIENDYGTNPNLADSDGDGLSDGDEVYTHGTSPVDADSDLDQLPDGWEVSYGLSPTSTTGDDGATGNPDDDAFTNLEEYQNGTDPTIFDGGQPPEEFSGTWIGTYETTSSATIEQTGADVTVTFPIGSGGMTGTVSGDTLTADGTLWTGEPASVSLTISDTQVSGVYESGTAGNIDQGTFDLMLTSGPPAQIQTGDWYGTIEDKYDYEYQIHGVFFTNIEVHSSSHIVVNVEYEVENPGEVFSLAGEIAGNVFMAMYEWQEGFEFVTGLIEADGHISGYFQEKWTDDYESGFCWGEFEQWVSPDAPVDLSGSWRIIFTDVYADDPESDTVDLRFTQNGSSLSMVEMPMNGEVRGNRFVLVGNDDDGAPTRIDGEMNVGNGSISGTFEGEDDWEWWWGTYTGQRR